MISGRGYDEIRVGDQFPSAMPMTETHLVIGMEDRPQHGGGLVHLDGSCTNQNGVLVAEARAQFIVRNADPRQAPAGVRRQARARPRAGRTALRAAPHQPRFSGGLTKNIQINTLPPVLHRIINARNALLAVVP